MRGSRTSIRGAWITASAVVVFLVGSFLVVQAALQRFPFGPGGDPTAFRIAVVHCVLVAYLVGAYLFVQAGAREAILALYAQLDHSEPGLKAEHDRVGEYSRGVLIALAVAGMLISSAGPYLTGPNDMPYSRPDLWSAEVAWHRVLGLGIGWGINWIGLAVVMESLRLSRLAGSLKAISLWDARPLAPFTRQGLRNALVAVGLVSVFALFVPEQGVTNAFLLILAVSSTLALLGLLLPLQGVHRAIRAAKQQELDWTALAIQEERARFQQQASSSGRLADVVAYRASVEQVRDWPFDQSSVLRFVLYLLVPIASWLISNVAAELLEQIVFSGR
jgi:hypothetical protein